MNSTGLQHYRWYHGRFPRAETERILNGKQPGIYLVRDSTTSVGDYVLSVSENHKVSHYIINNKDNHYKIGEQTFADIPSIISFYKDHFLDTTTLTGAIEREMKVQALYNFDGNDPEDLPFQKGDILTIVNQDEESWWTAENSRGQRGSIPVPYVQLVSDNQLGQPQGRPPLRPQSSPLVLGSTTTYIDPYPSQGQANGIRRQSHPVTMPEPRRPSLPRPVEPPPAPLCWVTPAYTGADINLCSTHSPSGPLLARAVIDRVCSPYDNRQLSFKKGDLLMVTKQNDNGIWEGNLNGKSGEFPMSHVNVIDPNTMEPLSNGF